MSVPVVKFARQITAGMKGPDVEAIKRVCSRAGTWPWAEFDQTAHPEFMNGHGKTPATSGLKGLQKKLKVKIDGVYGQDTHRQSLPFRVPKGKPHTGEYCWDAHSQALYQGAYPELRAAKVLEEIWTWWEWMVERQSSIHYSQMRPMRELSLRHKPPRLPFSEDCSSTFIYCAFLGGAKSPDVANGFSGYGNTDSLVQCGQTISSSQIGKWAKTHYIGVYYGTSVWATHHVAAAKSSSVIYSMGNENAPERYRSISDGPGQVAAIKAHPVI